jgi:hypothetical protein
MNRAGAWTQEQYETLRTFYPFERSVDVAVRIGRTKSAVDHMASRLQIKKNEAAMYVIKSEAMKGESSGNFKGYRRKTTKGYITLYRPNEPGTDRNGLIMEHRYLMAQHIGRAIRNDEAVHHINGIKNDNRIDNLQLMTVGEHSALHNKKRKKAS